ncbi:MAG: cell division protein ZapA [Lachnospiraceae bacterium]|nr:cell division protein ZapA [Lachnospiraceae bacterium]
MSDINETQVIIAGRVLTLKGYETAEYTQKVANYLNKKHSECKATVSFRSQNKEMQMLLVALNIADDYMKIHDRLEEVENILKDKDKEIYNLKHDIVTTQSRLDKADEQVRTLQDKMAESSKKLIQLDAKLRNKDKRQNSDKENEPARSEIKAESRPEVRSEKRPETKPELKPESKPEVKPEAKNDVKPAPVPESKPEVKPEAVSELGAESKPEIRQDVKAETKPEPAHDGVRPVSAPAPGPGTSVNTAPGTANSQAAEKKPAPARPIAAPAPGPSGKPVSAPEPKAEEKKPEPAPSYRQESLFDDVPEPVSEPRLVKGGPGRDKDDDKGTVQFPFNKR